MAKRFECHLHSHFSNIRLVDCINRPESIVKYAKEIGLAGFCITDHECLSGHIQFNKLAQENPDIKIGLGNEIYLVDERPNDSHYHFILIAKDIIGHKQLRYLSSLAWMNSYTAKRLERVDTLKSDLERVVKNDPGHLIASTACLGSELDKTVLGLIKAEKNGDNQTAEIAHDQIVDFLTWCIDLFGNDFYIECQPGKSKEQIMVNSRLISIANAFNVKMIVTTDAHYLRKDDRYVHKAFLNSKDGEREVDSFYQDAYLQTNDEVIDNLKLSNFDKTFVEAMFANTMEIYDKIETYSLFHTQQIPKVDVIDYPPINPPFVEKYPILNSLYMSDNKIERYWINQCVDKLHELNKFNDIYLSRLEEEATTKRIIGEKLQTNIFEYPVTLQHYVDMFWDCGSAVGAGRGSSCAGLNHYLLGVTQLDPIEWNFPWFRYLNKERVELPSLTLILGSCKKRM